jgi:aminopeptidase N
MARKWRGIAMWAMALGLAGIAWAAPAPERLPAGIAPVHYDLALFPDASQLTFRGHVQIDIDVAAPAPAIVLNASKLALDKAALDGKPAVHIQLDSKLERASFQFGSAVPAGRHTLAIDYHGKIVRTTLGFFAMDYDTPAGKRRTIATNFEPSSERLFMPSWDEPGFKATFSITVDVPAGQMAVSNMPAASTEKLANGQERVHFATTPKMSTYLLFLGIGDFERITARSDGTDVGVVVNRGDAEKGRYALEQAASLLHYYNGYFGVHFPLPKLDLIVAPGDIDGGAMENWGAIFYGQEDLLFDPQTSTESDRQRVFAVVAHEMSHQWFGDLVTMAWWDNLWLNEGFARWMQTKAADDLHPEWKTGLQAQRVAERGKRADAKPSTHPIVQTILTARQAELAFDDITYNKGATVIGMLEKYVSPDAFRDGVRRYMQAHAYGNTVDADLWKEVQNASGKPVLQVEADFTKQAGVPLLRAEIQQSAGGGENKIMLSEGRFVEDPKSSPTHPAETWHIPVLLSAGAAPVTDTLDGSKPLTAAVAGRGPVIVNSGQSSFVRTLYSQAMIGAIAANLSGLDAVDQLGILYDVWALGESGYAPVTNYLDLTQKLPVNADPVVWMQVVATFDSLDRLYRDLPGRAALSAYVRIKLDPLAALLGWEARKGEDPNADRLRNSVLETLSEFDDQAVIAEAGRRFDQAQQNPSDVPPAVRRTALAIVARHADPQTFEKLMDLYRATKDSLEKEKIWEALAGVADPKSARRLLEMAAGPEAPAGTVEATFGEVSLNHPDLAWNFAIQHVDQPGYPLETAERLRLMPEIARASNDTKRATELDAYARQHIPASARRQVVSAVATIQLNARFRAERMPEMDAWLSRNTGIPAVR